MAKHMPFLQNTFDLCFSILSRFMIVYPRFVIESASCLRLRVVILKGLLSDVSCSEIQLTLFAEIRC